MQRSRTNAITKRILKAYQTPPMKKYILLAFFFSALTATNAQDKQERITDAHVSNYRDWALSFGFGNTFMAGDLQSWGYNSLEGELTDFYFGPTGYISATKYFSSVWGLTLEAEAGQMGGDFGTAEEYPNFQTFFINFYPQVTINLSALALKGKVHDRKWSHLVRLGMGATFNRPDLSLSDDVTLELRGDGDSEDWNNAVLYSFTYNLKYRLSNAWDLDLKIGGRSFIGDNIDGWGEGIPQANAGGQDDDFTLFTGLGLTYNFGNKEGEGENDKISVVYTNPLDDLYGDIQKIREDYEKIVGDDDNDGVSNYFDKDNATPADVTVNGDGVATDADGDGIPDYLDEDPFTMKGAKVDEKGRAIDSDGDGVPDIMDEEANTPAGALVNFKGMAIPIMKESGSGGAMPSVFFNFNSATVTAANHYRLATIARMLKTNSKVKVKLVGYTDKSGPEEYNVKLGQRRAEEVAKQLTQVYGIDSSRIIASESKGESELLANGRNDVNRRVDVIVQ